MILDYNVICFVVFFLIQSNLLDGENDRNRDAALLAEMIYYFY